VLLPGAVHLNPHCQRFGDPGFGFIEATLLGQVSELARPLHRRLSLQRSSACSSLHLLAILSAP
jgi:hypothetical protein